MKIATRSKPIDRAAAQVSGGALLSGSVLVSHLADGREIYSATDLKVGLFTSTEDF